MTADLNATKKQIEQVVRDNHDLQQNNKVLQAQLGEQKVTSVSIDKNLSSYPIANSGSTPSSSQSTSMPSNNASILKPSAFDIRNVPGYNTAFNAYDKDYYALPSDQAD